MAQNLILHIGHPKTGTSTLQQTMRASHAVLADAGVLHPNTGPNVNNKALIPHLVGGEPVGRHTDRRLGRTSKNAKANSAKIWANVLAQVKKQDPETVVISSEGLSRPRGRMEMQNMKDCLRELAPDCTVVAYLREPASFNLSRAQQMIKSQPNYFLSAKNYYRAMLEPYVLSGIGPMNVRIFDRNFLAQGDLITDFFEQNLPGFDIAGLSRISDVNTSFSAEAMALIQEIHRNERSFPRPYPRLLIAKVDHQLKGFSRPVMHEHVRKAIATRCSDLTWLNNELDLKFPNIDRSSLPLAEANDICNSLDRVEDLCMVDTDRKAELWNASLIAAGRVSRIVYRVYNVLRR